MKIATYSGNKLRNEIKIKEIKPPDRIRLYLFETKEGLRHDMNFFSHSGVEEGGLQQLKLGGVKYSIYEESTYVLRHYMAVEF